MGYQRRVHGESCVGCQRDNISCQWLPCAHKAARIRMRIFIFSFIVHTSISLDLGRSGVWDSPLATDQFVKQFGWTFGGGRRGVAGVQVMNSQLSLNLRSMKYDSLYKYEFDKNNRLNLFPSPVLTVAPSLHLQDARARALTAKTMVALPAIQSKSRATFHPFMAVP